MCCASSGSKNNLIRLRWRRRHLVGQPPARYTKRRQIMAVITISRQHGSGGHEVTRLICARLGYRYFDKELMAQLGAQIGLAPDQVVDLPEDKHRVQSVIERLFANVPNPLGDPGEW